MVKAWLSHSEVAFSTQWSCGISTMKLRFLRSEVFCVPQKVVAIINNDNNLPNGQTSLCKNFTFRKAKNFTKNALQRFAKEKRIWYNRFMITYEPFYKTLKAKNISTYKLINDYKVSSSLIDRLKHNKPITTVTLNDLCKILDCKVEDILLYIPEE